MVSLSDESLAALSPTFAELEARAVEALDTQHVPQESRRLVRTVDVRYLGQEHSLPVELREGDAAADILKRFGELHEARHGHAMDVAGQIFSVRLRAVGEEPKPGLVTLEAGEGTPEPVGSRRAFDMAARDWAQFPVYERGTFRAGQSVAGPAIVEEGTSTTVFFSDQSLTVDAYGHLLITSNGASQ
nr:hypothetical protein [Kineosporia babensis]